MMISGVYAILNAMNHSVHGTSSLVSLAQEYLKGGIRILQLRDKWRNDSVKRRGQFIETAQKIKNLKKDFDFVFIVNDDVVVAREVGADGVHVGKDDASIEECREILTGDHPSSCGLVGYSSHDIEEAIEAERRGADYVAFGAIYPSPSKGPGHPVQGIEKLREVVRRVKIPVVAIGGIGRENIKGVLATGVSSVAMISALANASDRVVEAKYFLSLWGED